ncbi:hypothetical protein [Chroococcidiopsis sp. CCMEE 29]|uniref:hypothetical protein n=1 Tax=Chroococcidiopsis sp. CCMEE 29 TaxID=155894 RepID=UPI0020202239|nr:hypothetical protein [Chroococcidiopsis sp. CCMEE 29]
MLNLERIHPSIVADLRERMGKKANDASADPDIAAMSPESAFIEFCEYHSDYLADVLTVLRAASSDASPRST